MKKTCTKCHQEKVLDDFNKQAAGRLGRTSACRDCDRARQAKWRQENPEATRAAKKRWNEQNPDYAKNYREENAERMLELKREWRKKNPERVAEYQRQWVAKNLEAVAANRQKFKEGAEAETKATAVNKSKPWSEEDLAMLLREDLSIKEISKHLGRTYGSVATRRSTLIEHHKRLAMIEDVQRRLAG